MRLPLSDDTAVEPPWLDSHVDSSDADDTLIMREYWQSHWNPGTTEGLNCADMRRVGPRGDGAKMVCFDSAALPSASEPCHVVSVGVGGSPGLPPDFCFETALHAERPSCTIDVFDGTNFGRGPINNAPSFVQFHPVNFDAETWSTPALLAYPKIHVFKIDCEGCEFDSVLPFVEHHCPEQIMMEVHGGDGRHDQVSRLMGALNASHGIFYREPNIAYSDGTCIEFAWRRRPGAACKAPRVPLHKSWRTRSVDEPPFAAAAAHVLEPRASIHIHTTTSQVHANQQLAARLSSSTPSDSEAEAPIRAPPAHFGWVIGWLGGWVTSCFLLIVLRLAVGRKASNR